MKKIFMYRFGHRLYNVGRVLGLAVPILFGLLPVTAQRLEPSVLAAAGGVIGTADGGSLSWTLGEIIVDEIREEGVLITQGFQQGDFKISTSFHTADFPYEISAFPNPVGSKIQVKSDYPEKLNYRLYGPNGQLVAHGDFAGNIELNANSWIDGFYFMSIKRDGILVSSMIIERIH